MAKKRFCVLYVLFFCLFVFNGCSSANTASNSLTTDFSAEFTSFYKGNEYRGTLSTIRQGISTIRFSSPPTVDGITFTYHSNELEFSIDSLICSADEAYLPGNSLPNIIRIVLTELSNDNATLVSDNGNTKMLSMNTKAGTATLTVTDNQLTKAEIDSADFIIELSNIKTTE